MVKDVDESEDEGNKVDGIFLNQVPQPTAPDTEWGALPDWMDAETENLLPLVKRSAAHYMATC